MRNDFYQPRNLRRPVDLPGNQATRDHIEQMEAFGGYMESTDKMVIPRVEDGQVYAVEDLRYMAEKFGRGSGWDAAMRDATEAQRRSMQRTGRPLFTTSIEGGRTWDRFFRDTGEAWATHIQEASPAVKAAMNAARASEGRVNYMRRADAPTLQTDKDGNAVTTRIGWRDADRASPLSRSNKGYSVGQALSESYTMIPEEHLRQTVSSTILPAITRRGLDNQHLISLGQFQQAKQFFGWLTKTRPVQALREQSEWGKNLVERMETLADPQFRGFGGAASRPNRRQSSSPWYTQPEVQVSLMTTRSSCGRSGFSRRQIQRASTSLVGFSRPSISFR